MRLGATCSAGRAKKDWGRAGRYWIGVAAMEVAGSGSAEGHLHPLGGWNIVWVASQLN